jgi:hypothetical protein
MMTRIWRNGTDGSIERRPAKRVLSLDHADHQALVRFPALADGDIGFSETSSLLYVHVKGEEVRRADNLESQIRPPTIRGSASPLDLKGQSESPALEQWANVTAASPMRPSSRHYALRLRPTTILPGTSGKHTENPKIHTSHGESPLALTTFHPVWP